MGNDIVTRLRVIHCAADDLTPCGTCLPCQAADEIERLQDAGDALAVHLDAFFGLGDPCPPNIAACLSAWHEARHNR